MTIERRLFLKCGLYGLSGLIVGCGSGGSGTVAAPDLGPGPGPAPVPGPGPAPAPVVVRSLNFRITDAVKEMVTHNAVNDARCYFWIYKDVGQANFPADCPGPNVFAFEGDQVDVNLTNALDEPHNFAIPAANIVSPTVAPGATVSFSFTVPKAGTYLYYDSLNAPVNRVMGLHGAFIVMPAVDNGTPYSAADKAAAPKMAQLFADLGVAAWWPGLAWNEGDTASVPPTPAFRQFIWLLHQASPVLFAEVGNAPAGGDFNSTTFVERFLNAPLNPGLPATNQTPQFFTIDGQSGHFSHSSPFICPNLRAGEPCLIRVLNAGLWTHSMHIHANHVFVLQVNNSFGPRLDTPGQTDNNIWIDTFTSKPLDTYDWLNPYMRPPDVPNTLGNGRADLHDPLPLATPGQALAPATFNRTPGVLGDKTWPPLQELNMAIPPVGTLAGTVPIHMPLSPLCFPMHDHSEPSQTSQGGNYNLGLIAGMNFTGDRTIKGRPRKGAEVPTFPMAPTQFDDPAFTTADNRRAVTGAGVTGPAAGPVMPFEETG